LLALRRYSRLKRHLLTNTFRRQARLALADEFHQPRGSLFPRTFQFRGTLMRFSSALFQVKQAGSMFGPCFSGAHLRTLPVFLKMIANGRLSGGRKGQRAGPSLRCDSCSILQNFFPALWDLRMISPTHHWIRVLLPVLFRTVCPTTKRR
jgi:hypothetical protein